MKKLLILSLTAITFLLSCEKDHNETDENLCPVVEASNVPEAVKTAFNSRYSTQSVQIWFNKDNTGYSAFFLLNGIKKLVQFTNDGTFVKEEIKTDEEHEGENKDTLATTGKLTNTGCECEIHKEDD